MKIETYLKTLEAIADRFENESPIRIRADFAVQVRETAAQCSLPPAITFDDYKAHSLDDETPDPLNVKTMRTHVYDPFTQRYDVHEVDEWPIDEHGTARQDEDLRVTPIEEHKQNRAHVARMLRAYVKHYTPALPIADPTLARADALINLLESLQGQLARLNDLWQRRADNGHDEGNYADIRKAAATVYLSEQSRINAKVASAPFLGPLVAHDVESGNQKTVTLAGIDGLDLSRNDLLLEFAVRHPTAIDFVGYGAVDAGRVDAIETLIAELKRNPIAVLEVQGPTATPAPEQAEPREGAAGDEFVSVTEAAKRYVVQMQPKIIQFKSAVETISRACRNGVIESSGTRKDRRIHVTSLDAWMLQQTNRAATRADKNLTKRRAKSQSTTAF